MEAAKLILVLCSSLLDQGGLGELRGGRRLGQEGEGGAGAATAGLALADLTVAR